MAKEFSKVFYASKQWKDTREAYFTSQYGICELCERPGEEVHHKIFLKPDNMDNSEITLDWSNLQLLCKRCHNVQHNKAYEMQREKLRKNHLTSMDTIFDAEGNLIENKTVHLVWGAPASGKTTYVKSHKGKYDIVVDLDYIMSALSLSDSRERSPDAFPFALYITNVLHELIRDRTYFFEHAWIVATLPDKQKRNKLIKELKAESIHIDTDINECLFRAKLDDDRADKTLQYKIINKYFNDLQL